MNLEVRKIQYHETKPFILKRHYAKRMPQIVWAFGLFDKNKIIGVVTYGRPASPYVCVSICGHDYRELVYELNRLCLLYNRRNEASFLVSGSLRMLPRPKIIVSFADTAWHHTGVIYQATNWVYTGTTEPRKDKMRSGHKKHARHSHVYEKGWDGDVEIVDRSIKHRYVYFLGSKKEKKQMRKALRFEQKPYPKADKQNYETESIDIQLRMF